MSATYLWVIALEGSQQPWFTCMWRLVAPSKAIEQTQASWLVRKHPICQNCKEPKDPDMAGDPLILGSVCQNRNTMEHQKVKRSALDKWQWVKNRNPKWNPGKGKHGLKPAVPWWLNFDPYPSQKKSKVPPRQLGAPVYRTLPAEIRAGS